MKKTGSISIKMQEVERVTSFVTAALRLSLKEDIG
jgi:hypothetical protein